LRFSRNGVELELMDHEDGGTKIILNVGDCLPVDRRTHPKTGVAELRVKCDRDIRGKQKTMAL
jgi:hypothetical protein